MKFLVLLQYALPHHSLSKIAHFLAKAKYAPFKNLLINHVVKKFQVDMSEAVICDPLAYESFNKFFTRELRINERKFSFEPESVIALADGKISQIGRVFDETIVQAKKRPFTLCDLLGDQKKAENYKDGWFVNIYLSPRDYHRIHMPLDGELVETVYIPGRLFSVAPWAVRAIPNLFSRNERLVCHFETTGGPMCVVLVGAMLVSGIETVWGGNEIPSRASGIRQRDYRGLGISLTRFSEMARFNFGSTVICFWTKDAVSLSHLEENSPTVVGKELGRLK
jgi:phosphatidylserine decarboxylase